MTTESAMNQVGAISRVDDWHSTDWQKVNQNVRRLQARIARGNTGKEMEQGQSPTTSFNQLVKRQAICRQTSYGKLWKENFGRG